MDGAVDLLLGDHERRGEQKDVVEQRSGDKSVFAGVLGYGGGPGEPRRRKSFLRLLVGYNLDAGHEAERADIADMGKLKQFIETPAQITPALLNLGDEAL